MQEVVARVLRRAAVELLESRQLLSAAYPTAAEQYMVELINRARMNPVAEAQRYGIDLNEGLSAGTISIAAKQPVAINVNLTDAARSHAQWLRQAGTLSHTGANNSDPGGRIAASGYGPVNGWTENVALSLSGGTLTPEMKMDGQHGQLFTDLSVSDRGHRTNMMTEWVREVGVGAESGPMTYNGNPWGGSVITAEDFATRGGDAFLTGVAFSDAVNTDQFYTIGEGLGGVTITATRTDNSQSVSTTTWDSGGYSLRLAPGTWNVSATGGGLNSPVYYNAVAIGDANVKRDFRPGQNSDPAPVDPTPPTPSFGVIANRVLTLTGTDANDVLTLAGTGGNVVATLNGLPMTFAATDIDVVFAYADSGNDAVTITGSTPPVYVDGGEGKDTLIGSVGNDTLTGGAQADSINGNGGEDRINGSGGNDNLIGGEGGDRIYGQAGDDALEGNSGVDRLWGGDGNDTLSGGTGFDKLFGENGDDQLFGGVGDDFLVGADGEDYLHGGDGLWDTADNDFNDTRVAVEVLN